MKAVSTLILVCDDENARFLENRGVGKGLKEVGSLSAGDFAETDIAYSDRPGRSQGGAGTSVHAVDRSASEEIQQRNAFARLVVERSQNMVKDYDRFAMAAPAKMLGELRGLIDNTLSERLSFDLAKDLVKTPLDRMPDHFSAHMAV